MIAKLAVIVVVFTGWYVVVPVPLLNTATVISRPVQAAWIYRCFREFSFTSQIACVQMIDAHRHVDTVILVHELVWNKRKVNNQQRKSKPDELMVMLVLLTLLATASMVRLYSSGASSALPKNDHDCTCKLILSPLP